MPKINLFASSASAAQSTFSSSGESNSGAAPQVAPTPQSTLSSVLVTAGPAGIAVSEQSPPPTTPIPATRPLNAGCGFVSGGHTASSPSSSAAPASHPSSIACESVGGTNPSISLPHMQSSVVPSPGPIAGQIPPSATSLSAYPLQYPLAPGCHTSSSPESSADHAARHYPSHIPYAPGGGTNPSISLPQSSISPSPGPIAGQIPPSATSLSAYPLQYPLAPGCHTSSSPESSADHAARHYPSHIPYAPGGGTNPSISLPQSSISPSPGPIAGQIPPSATSLSAYPLQYPLAPGCHTSSSPESSADHAARHYPSHIPYAPGGGTNPSISLPQSSISPSPFYPTDPAFSAASSHNKKISKAKGRRIKYAGPEMDMARAKVRDAESAVLAAYKSGVSQESARKDLVLANRRYQDLVKARIKAPGGRSGARAVIPRDPALLSQSPSEVYEEDALLLVSLSEVGCDESSVTGPQGTSMPAPPPTAAAFRPIKRKGTGRGRATKKIKYAGPEMDMARGKVKDAEKAEAAPAASITDPAAAADAPLSVQTGGGSRPPLDPSGYVTALATSTITPPTVTGDSGGHLSSSPASSAISASPYSSSLTYPHRWGVFASSQTDASRADYTQSISRSLAGCAARSSASSGEVEGAEYVTETEARRLPNPELEKRRVYTATMLAQGGYPSSSPASSAITARSLTYAHGRGTTSSISLPHMQSGVRPSPLYPALIPFRFGPASAAASVPSLSTNSLPSRSSESEFSDSGSQTPILSSSYSSLLGGPPTMSVGDTVAAALRSQLTSAAVRIVPSQFSDAGPVANPVSLHTYIPSPPPHSAGIGGRYRPSIQDEGTEMERAWAKVNDARSKDFSARKTGDVEKRKAAYADLGKAELEYAQALARTKLQEILASTPGAPAPSITDPAAAADAPAPSTARSGTDNVEGTSSAHLPRSPWGVYNVLGLYTALTLRLSGSGALVSPPLLLLGGTLYYYPLGVGVPTTRLVPAKIAAPSIGGVVAAAVISDTGFRHCSGIMVRQIDNACVATYLDSENNVPPPSLVSAFTAAIPVAGPTIFVLEPSAQQLYRDSCGPTLVESCAANVIGISVREDKAVPLHSWLLAGFSWARSARITSMPANPNIYPLTDTYSSRALVPFTGMPAARPLQSLTSFASLKFRDMLFVARYSWWLGFDKLLAARATLNGAGLSGLPLGTALSPSGFRKAALNLHPDHAPYNKEAFSSVLNMKDAYNDPPTSRGPIIHMLSGLNVFFKGAEAVVDLIVLGCDPNLPNLKEASATVLGVYALKTGSKMLPLGLSGLLVAHTAYTQDTQAAFKQAVVMATYITVPTVVAFISIPASIAVSVGTALFTAYPMISKIIKAFRSCPTLGIYPQNNTIQVLEPLKNPSPNEEYSSALATELSLQNTSGMDNTTRHAPTLDLPTVPCLVGEQDIPFA